jgi:membrane protease YdiL (CAAX protease family)
MNTTHSKWKFRIYHAAFIILTFLCWSPLLYGSYGKTGLIFSIPSWAAIALFIGVVLVALQWFYLFHSGLAMSDDTLDEIVYELRKTAKESTQTVPSK